MSSVSLLVQQILTAKSSNRNVLLTFLCNCSQFKSMINSLFVSEISASDIKQKEQYLYLIEDVILNKQNSLDLLTQEEIKQLIRIIIDYPVSNNDSKFYDKMKKVLLLIFNHTDSNELNDIFNLISEPPGFYSSYALVILSTVKSISDSLIFNIFKKLIESLSTQSYPSLLAFSTFMESHVLSELGSDCITLWNDDLGAEDHFIDFIKPMLISELSLQRMGIKFVESCFHFLEPDTSIQIFLTLVNPILNILHKSIESTKLQIASLFGKIPTNCSTELSSPQSQLFAFLKDLAQHITNCEGLYVNEVLNFVRQRKDCDSFDDLISDLYKDPQTIRAAILICSEFEIFERKPNLLEKAFPPDICDKEMVQNVLQIAPVLIKRRKITKEIFIALSRCFFAILSNNIILGDVSFKPNCFCLISLYMQNYDLFTNEFAEQFLENVSRISDRDILSCLSAELKTTMTTFKDKTVPPPDQAKYVKYFTHLARFYFDNDSLVSEFSSFLRVFKPKEEDSQIQTYPQMIDYYVPTECIPDIKAEFIRMLKEEENYALYLMYLPSLSFDELKNYSSVAFDVPKTAKDGSINKIFFCKLFNAMCLRYTHQVFQIFDSFLTAKVSKAVQIFGIKHKQLMFSVKISILMTIGQMAHQLSQMNLSKDTQDLIYKVITLSLTTPEDFKQFPSCSKVLDVFPLLKDSEAPEKLLEAVAPFPLFADSLFYLVKNQKNAPKLLETFFLSWIEHLSMYNMSANKNKDFCDLMFKIDPTNNTLTLILQKLIPKLSLQDPIPFCDFIYKATIVAEQHKLQVSVELLAQFLISSAPLCLHSIDDVRKITIKSLMNIFRILSSDLSENDPLNELELIINERQKVKIYLSLFLKIFQHMKPEFSQICLEKITFKAKTLSFPHALMSRACLEINGKFLLQNAAKSISTLMELTSNPSNSQTQHQIVLAFMDLSQKSMDLFLPLLIASTDITYKRLIVKKILQSEQRKNSFFEQYNMLLMQVTTALDLFQILPSVIMSESTTMTPQIFGHLLESILIWVTAYYANQQKLSRKQITKAKEEVNQCLTHILDVANVSVNKQIDLQLTSFNSFSETIESMMLLFESLEIEYIQGFCISCFNIINSSNNEFFKQTSIMCFIFLENIFGKCTNLVSIQLCCKLLESITLSFQKLSQRARRNVVVLMHQKLPFEYLQKLTHTQASNLFLSLIENLCCDIAEDGQIALEVLSYVLPFVPKETISQSLDDILKCLRKICDTQPFSMPLLDLLEIYVNQRALFTDFISNTKLNIVYLLDLMQNQRQDVRQRTSSIIKLLVGNLETLELTSYMKQNELEKFALSVIQKISLTSITSDIMNLVLILTNMLLMSESEESNEFKTKVVLLCSDIVYGSQFSEQATNILKSLIP